MKHEPRPAIHMEKQLLKLGGAESLGMSKVSQTVITKLMGPQMWYQLAGSMGGAIRKGTMTSACLNPDTSVSPCVPLMPFKLLPQCWSSEGMSVSG